MISTRAGRLIVLAAGGTGGHVFPAEALAQELLAQGHRLALITDKRGTGYTGTLGLIDTYHIRGQGIAGQGLVGKLKGVIALGAGVLDARRLLHELKPAAVVGFGGYASAPTVVAATQLGIPTVIHEQNAVLGRANRLLARRVNRVCTSFDLARPAPAQATVIRTGLPVRPAVAAMRNTPYATPDADGPFRIVVMGGSQGARIFSDVIPAAVRLLPESFRKRLEISQQCRPEELDRTHAAYADTGAHVELRCFFDNVPVLMANAHLLITRSGASTVAEATVVGRPSLLVPYPFAADDHQTANAQAVDAAGGAWMIRQPFFTPEDLAQRLNAFAVAPYSLAAAATAAAAFAVPDAAHRLADVVTTLIRGENGARAATKTAAPPPPISTHTMNRGII
jgi:UDP-N-acetylglucosamine--N-acetylmuramyl-(pentapeptide) pyrophosphoryl-undecaprenol N-acetylglucosamine transferase